MKKTSKLVGLVRRGWGSTNHWCGDFLILCKEGSEIRVVYNPFEDKIEGTYQPKS